MPEDRARLLHRRCCPGPDRPSSRASSDPRHRDAHRTMLRVPGERATRGRPLPQPPTGRRRAMDGSDRLGRLLRPGAPRAGGRRRRGSRARRAVTGASAIRARRGLPVALPATGGDRGARRRGRAAARTHKSQRDRASRMGGRCPRPYRRPVVAVARTTPRLGKRSDPRGADRRGSRSRDRLARRGGDPTARMARADRVSGGTLQLRAGRRLGTARAAPWVRSAADRSGGDGRRLRTRARGHWRRKLGRTRPIGSPLVPGRERRPRTAVRPRNGRMLRRPRARRPEREPGGGVDDRDDRDLPARANAVRQPHARRRPGRRRRPSRPRRIDRRHRR